MKIGIKYSTFYDCSGLIYALSEGVISYLKPKVISIKYQTNEYIFSQYFEDLKDVDQTIILIVHLQQCHGALQEAKQLGLTKFKVLQMQMIENYQCPDNEILDFLNKGNIILSSASVNFNHNNFVYDPFFNLFYLYNSCGYNYINYHQNANKKSLMGIYYRPVHVDGGVRRYRTYLYEKAKSILNDDLICYSSNNKKSQFELLLETHNGFGFWNQTYISTYTDYNTSVCNIMYETIGAISHIEYPNNIMFNREYITEKTLQSLLYSKENIFFIWYGPKRMLEKLRDMGFWFLNLEFYDETEPIIILKEDPNNGIRFSPVENSVIKSLEYIKDLKDKFKSNDKVYEYLLKTYGNRLQQNANLLDKILINNPHKEKILQLIEK